MYKKLSYKVISSRSSNKALCNKINTLTSNQNSIKCFNFDDENIFIIADENPNLLQKKLEKNFNIELEKVE